MSKLIQGRSNKFDYIVVLTLPQVLSSATHQESRAEKVRCSVPSRAWLSATLRNISPVHTAKTPIPANCGHNWDRSPNSRRSDYWRSQNAARDRVAYPLTAGPHRLNGPRPDPKAVPLFVLDRRSGPLPFQVAQWRLPIFPFRSTPLRTPKRLGSFSG